ncbi:MAG: HEAT repeat domain-containing protein [Anaerolineales bacterium]|nr:HEAT repeat domain-containing protein [Anaerolineales bacterium]
MTSGSRSPRATCLSRPPASEAGLPELQFLIDELTSGDDARAERAAARLADLGPPAILLATQLLELGDPDQRWWAVRTLARLLSPQSTQALRRALSDTDVAVRQAAALGLREAGDPSCLPSLAEALADPDPLVARSAADALAAGRSEAVPHLSSALLDPRPRLRIEAARALALNPDPSVIPVLFSLLEDDSPLVAYWAEHGLEVHGQGMVFFPP